MASVTRGPPMAGFRQGPIMQHGLVITNVTTDFELLSLRSRMRGPGDVIAGGTTPANNAVLSIEHGDALFLQPDGARRMIGVQRNVPSCVVFAAFNLMNEKDANDAKFMGFAQNTVRPLQGQGLDNPVIACVVHGMQATLNNSNETIEAGDIVVALPPDIMEGVRQVGDPARTRLPERMATTGMPGHRAVAVMRSMHGAYSVFFNKHSNSLPRAFADVYGDKTKDAGMRDGLAAHAGGANSCVGFAEPIARALGLVPAGRNIEDSVRPFLPLQIRLYAEMQQYMYDLAGIVVTRRDVDTHPKFADASVPAYDALVNRLAGLPLFQSYSKYAFALHDEGAIKDRLNQMVRTFPNENKGPMLLTRLIVDHLEFVRSYFQTKVVGKAMAQSTPNTTLNVYVTAGA